MQYAHQLSAIKVDLTNKEAKQYERNSIPLLFFFIFNEFLLK